MNFLTNAKGRVLSLLLFLAAFAQAATDYSALTDGVITDITSIGGVLMGIGAAIIGVSVVFIIYRLVKRMLGG